MAVFVYKNLRILGENCVRHLMYIVCTYDIICMLDVLTMYVLMLMCKYSSFEYLQDIVCTLYGKCNAIVLKLYLYCIKMVKRRGKSDGEKGKRSYRGRTKVSRG